MILGVIIAIVGIAFVFFGAVIISGAPYVPTLDRPAQNAFNLLGLKKSQVFFDLGCGDGRMLIAAAERGYNAVGYELNPILVLVCRWRTRRYGKQVKVCWGSMYRADLSSADGVFVFMADLYMKRLDKLFRAQKHSFKVVSNAFEIPGRRQVARRGAMILYRYP